MQVRTQTFGIHISSLPPSLLLVEGKAEWQVIGSEVFHPLTLCTNDHFSAMSQIESRSCIHNAIKDSMNV